MTKAGLFKNSAGLIRKGKLEAKINGPVYGFGAGFYPTWDKGGVLDATGSPFHSQSQFNTSSGRMIQFYGGGVYPGGVPFQRTFGIGTEARGVPQKAWFLQNSITNSQRAVNDLRALLRLSSEATGHTKQQINEAFIEQWSSKDLGVTSLFPEDTGPGLVNPELFDVWEAEKRASLQHKPVWQSIIKMVDKIPKEGSSIRINQFRQRLARAFVFGGKGGSIMSHSDTSENVDFKIPRERDSLYKYQLEYNRQAATRTNSLLSALNEQIRQRLQMQPPSTTTVTVEKDSMMPEEQKHAIGGDAHDLPQPIGFSNTMDYAYNMMGRVQVGDTSDMEISQGYQHGLSRGAIMTTAQIRKSIEAGSTDEIKKNIYKYWKSKAIPDANRAIHIIKETAKKTFKVKTPSAEQMRSPYGRTTSRMGGVTSRGEGGSKWSAGKGVKNAALNEISMSTNAMLRKMKARLGRWTNEKSAKTAFGFANHMIGTWHQHLGEFTHSMTVSKDPHLTASIFLQVHQKGRHAMKIKQQAFAEEHVELQAGYHVLNILQKAGQITQRQKGNILFNMKSAELSRRIKGTGDSVVIGGINNTTGRDILNKSSPANSSLSIYLPPEAEQTIYKNILKSMDDPFDRIAQDLKRTTRDHTGRFNNALNQDLWRERREGFFWPHLATLWSAPYMARIQQN